jgi:hypothetical protein
MMRNDGANSSYEKDPMSLCGRKKKEKKGKKEIHDVCAMKFTMPMPWCYEIHVCAKKLTFSVVIIWGYEIHSRIMHEMKFTQGNSRNESHA